MIFPIARLLTHTAWI